MPNNKEVKTNRDRYMERLKGKYPDKEYADDDAIFGQVNEDYDSYDNELAGYREREKALSDLFASNPRSAAFLTDWRKGEDPIIGMVRKFGDDFKAALEDPDKQEALAAANKEFAERIAKEEQYEKEYQANINETLTNLESMQQEAGLSDDDIDNAMEFLVSIVRDGIMGKFTQESVSMALKAIKHDSDVEQADREGEVRGKNAKIEEKLRKASRNDGTANIGSKNGGGNGSTREMPDLGVIDRNYGSQNIWERGGEKRRQYK
ncbi:MAG: hypothetical protein ACI358_01445 [Candidatus Limimorpha sp.]